MRVTVVGCAGSFPTATSAGSCYLVEHDDHRIVLDLGNGALGALQGYVDLDREDVLDAVVLSHCHADHCVDVASLHVYRQYHPERTWPALPLIGPAEAPRRLAAVYGMPDPAPLARVFAMRSLADGPHAIGPFTIRSVPAAHPVEAYSLRVDADGRSLVFSGDTGPNPALGGLAAGADLALVEASFVGEGNPPNLHMTGADAGRMAQSAGVGRLVLTHLVAWNDERQVLAEAQAHFSGPIEIARPGVVLTC